MGQMNSTRRGKQFLDCFTGLLDVAEANSQHAREMAQKLSHQFRAAENRITELEAEVRMYPEKADHAEQWLPRSIRRLRIDFCDRAGRRGAPQRSRVH